MEYITVSAKTLDDAFTVELVLFGLTSYLFYYQVI